MQPRVPPLAMTTLPLDLASPMSNSLEDGGPTTPRDRALLPTTGGSRAEKISFEGSAMSTTSFWRQG